MCVAEVFVWLGDLVADGCGVTQCREVLRAYVLGHSRSSVWQSVALREEKANG